jgi:mono/diheme cytochrome c family protein
MAQSEKLVGAVRIEAGAVLLICGMVMHSSLFGQTPTVHNSKRTPLPLDGAKIFRDYCTVCHGPDGKGKGPAARALRHAPPDLTLISKRNHGRFPANKVKAIISGEEQSTAAHGSREMPIWGPIFHDVEWDKDLGHVRLDNVTKFLESLQKE